MRQAPTVHIALLSLLLIMAACSRIPLQETAHSYLSTTASGDCLELYGHLENRLSQLGLADTQAARITGFPFLRANRFLASYRGENLDPAQERFWLERAAALDREARTHEVRNLPASVPREIAPATGTRQALIDRLAICSGLLLADVIHTGGTAKLVRERARVADNYSSLKRLLGLYPVTALFVLAGVGQLHEEVHETFATPLSELPVRGRLNTYLPPGDAGGKRSVPGTVAGILRGSADNPLQIPLPEEAERRFLLRRFAPVWEIDTVDRNDRFGIPHWQEDDRIAINTERPAVYQYLSHTRYGNSVLLQLNYTIWFPSRPAAGPLDILSGHLDGLTWRVTLDGEGAPLLYDVMHNCGCYHKFFPGEILQVRQPEDLYVEPLLVPARAPVPGSNERIVIRVAPVSHYVENVRTVALGRQGADGGRYELRAYNELRSLPISAANTKSMFGRDGIVPGTERKEKYLLWPMGVLEPGAMRQRGHHATAFVGRRHFDDPWLLDIYFSREDRSAD